LLAISLVITFSLLYERQLSSVYAKYGESCLIKACDQTKALQCINETCQCNNYEESWNSVNQKCELKPLEIRLHNEKCLEGYTVCTSGSACINKICQCTTGFYWSGTQCFAKKPFASNCTTIAAVSVLPSYSPVNCINDLECAQCSATALLTCDSATSQCACSDSVNYYHDTTTLKCERKKEYYESCLTSLACNSARGLICQTSIGGSLSNCPGTSIPNRCDCPTGYYYETMTNKCELKKDYNRFCTSTCECDTANRNLQCLNNVCTCNGYSWYNGTACVPYNTISTAYNSPCFSNYDCRMDLGLTCSMSFACSCALQGYYWSSKFSMCVQCPAGWTLVLVGTVYRCYLYSTTTATFNGARQICQSYGGDLMVMNSVTEYTAVYNSMISETATWYWVGVFGYDSAGGPTGFTSVDGQAYYSLSWTYYASTSYLGILWNRPSGYQYNYYILNGYNYVCELNY